MPFNFTLPAYLKKDALSTSIDQRVPTSGRAYFAKPRRPKVGHLGDSWAYLFRDTSQGIRTSGRSALAWANALLGHRFDVTLWGFSGQRTDQITAAGGYTTAAASDVDVVVETCGLNDIHQNYTGAVMAANRAAGWDVLLAAGKIVVAQLVPPVAEATWTDARYTELREGNRLLRQYAAARSGVIVHDQATAYVVPSTGKGDPGRLVSDLMHPNALGGSVGGRSLATILGAIFPTNTLTDALPTDDYSSKVLLTSGFQTGTGGTFSAAAGGTGYSGSLASGFTCYPSSGATVTASKVARTDGIPGEWQRLAIASANPAADSTAYLGAASSTRWAVGDEVYGVAEVETDSDIAWTMRWMFLEVEFIGAAQYARSLHMATTDYSTMTGPLVRPDRLVFVTPHFVIPSGTTSVRHWLRFGGGGAVRIGRSNVVRV